MLKVTNLRETDNITPLMLRAYIAKKMMSLMNEYSVNNLDDIGCFVVLEQSEHHVNFQISSHSKYLFLLI
jgi:hypothetical protein